MGKKIKTSEEFWENNHKVLLTLSKENINKLDMIASKYDVSRSTVLNLFLNNLTGAETISLEDNVI